MNAQEKKAEKIIRMAYKNGGSVNLSILKFMNNEDRISPQVTQILSAYGSMTSSQIDSNYGWDVFKLNEKGMNFVKNKMFREE